MKPIIGLYGIQDRQDGPHPLETHDHAICRMEAGRVVRHVTLERHTRRRHDNRMHAHVEALGARVLDTPNEDVVLACADSFVGRAFVSTGGRWRIEAPPANELASAPVRARAHVNGREREAWVVPHELAHLGSSLPFTGGWEEGTLLVHVDGAASLSCCSAWHWRGGRLQLLHHGWELAEPVAGYGTNNLAQHLVGHTWREFLAVPGKLMGLAAWGTPDPAIHAWLDRHLWFARMRGGPAPFEDAARRELGWDGQLTWADPLVQTIAACFQQCFEESVLTYVERFATQTGARHLVLAGGGALNLPTNQRIADAGWFDTVFIPPCAGDDGLALGAASVVALFRGDPVARHSPFLDDLDAPTLGEPTEAEIVRLADAIARGETIATCLGAAEVGPRALGHRSLLVRPTVEDARRLSVERKGREPWRPVAPLVVAEYADELFEGTPSRSPLAPYMLGRFRARDLARVEAPGVVHVDGTARVQVVGDEPELRPVRRLLEALWERHRIRCVVNTSFNRKGEPLVQTVAQAREVATDLGIDLLWHGGGIERVTAPAPRDAEGFATVSAELVRWRWDAVHAAVAEGVFDRFPLADTAIASEPLRRLLGALAEMGLVAGRDGVWDVTARGAFLREDHPLSLAPAARYWASDGQAAWAQLPRALRDSGWLPCDPFAQQAGDPARVAAYHAAMAPYARHDYAAVPAVLDPGHRVLLDAGGGHGALAIGVLRSTWELVGRVLDRPEVVASACVPPDLAGRLSFIPGDLFAPWPARADAIVLARVLHDWSDDDALAILRRAREALEPGGRVYVIEMVRPEESFDGALLDLHMLLATGGRERTERAFRDLFARAELGLRHARPLPSVSSVLVAEMP